MSNNLHVSSVLTSTIQQTRNEYILNKEISRTLDTISTAQKQENKKHVHVGQRPSLPPSGKSQNPNYLSIVAEAFSKAFDSMSQGTIQQAKSYAELQQLDETMSQSVLQSTKLAIDKEEKEIKLNAEVAAYQEKSAKTDSIFSDILLALGIVLIVATVASALFDAGSSLAAIPEEISGICGELFGDGAAESAGDVELDTFTDSSSAEDVDPAESDEDVDASPTSSTESTTTTEETGEANQAERTTTDQLDQSSEENAKSEESSKGKNAKRLKGMMHVIAAFGFGTPMLLKGIQGSVTGQMLNKTAHAQQEIGAALATVQENNSYFQFYQQLLRQASGVVQEETNGASQVVETFSNITNAYQQISYGLASAV